MLKQKGAQRKHNNNMQMGGLTAIAAGMVNVASVYAFFTFSSNVTGHMAVFAEQIVRGNWAQVITVFIWLFMFLFGAFSANFLIHRLEHRGSFVAHSVPVFLEVSLLLGVGFYGINFYQDHLLETEIMVALLLFAMGNQNSMVATISNSVVKTTHVTGLFTDLGMELSQLTQKHKRQDPQFVKKFKLHLLIAVCYFFGGVSGGLFFGRYGFYVFYLAASILMFITFYDLLSVRFKQLSRKFRSKNSKSVYLRITK